MLERRSRAACVIQRHVRGTHVRAQLKQQHRAAELVQVNLSLHSTPMDLKGSRCPALQWPGGSCDVCCQPQRHAHECASAKLSVLTMSRRGCRPSGEDGGHAGQGAAASKTCGAACCDLQQPRLWHLTSSWPHAQRLPCSASCRASSMSRCRPDAAPTIGWTQGGSALLRLLTVC